MLDHSLNGNGKYYFSNASKHDSDPWTLPTWQKDVCVRVIDGLFNHCDDIRGTERASRSVRTEFDQPNHQAVSLHATDWIL